MNYRHAYHAGNFADCVKHALLVALLRAMARKPAPFFVLDTHAGTGRYDLTADEARRTNEAAGGIFRLLDNPPMALADYIAVVLGLGLYPGSPEIIRDLLRPGDGLACCELHPEDHAALKQLFRGDAQVAVHRRDGWEAVKALLPPKQKRGLILIDPPYENPNEFARAAAGLTLAHRRFPTGVFAVWYPVKHRAPVRQFLDAAPMRDIVTCELLLREPLDPTRLNGCGVLIVNPPYQFETEAQPILEALLTRLGTGEPGATVSIARIADE